MADSTPVLPTPMVSTAWLAEHLGDPRLAVVDASWYLATMERDPRAEFEAGHVPGAVFWDLDALSDPATDLPHMLPNPDDFEAGVSALGIRNEQAVVVYDGSGNNLSAPRVWWMFRVFGHDRVGVLDGGMGRWRVEGRPIEQGAARSLPPGRFVARLQPQLVRSIDDVLVAAQHGDQLLDARSTGRFEATEAEPRPGLRSGHVPGARNLPYGALVDAEGLILDRDRLAARFAAAGIDLNRPVVTSCGSGVTACTLALGLALVGRGDTAVYDGSWTEWGGRADTPVETGPPR